MAVTLAKKSNNVKSVQGPTIVSSVTLSDTFKVKGSKSNYSIRLETWKVNGSSSTEVKVVIRDENGQFHGATNFKQNIIMDFTNLMQGKGNKRK